MCPALLLLRTTTAGLERIKLFVEPSGRVPSSPQLFVNFLESVVEPYCLKKLWGLWKTSPTIQLFLGDHLSPILADCEPGKQPTFEIYMVPKTRERWLERKIKRNRLKLTLQRR